MDINSLRIFLSAAGTLNFTKTAEEFFLTQPVVSRRIQELEQEWGCRLFRRYSRGVELTAEGETMFFAVRQALESMDSGLKKIEANIQCQCSNIRIAGLTPAILSFLPAILERYQSENEKVDIDIVRMTPNEIRESLKSQEYDIYISNFAGEVIGKEFQTYFLKEDPLGLIIPENVDCVSKEDAYRLLSSKRLLLIPQEDSSALYQSVMRMLKGWHVQPREIRELRPVESLMFQIASGLGVGIMPDRIMPLETYGLKFFPLEGADRVRLKLICRKNAEAYIQQFIKFILEYMQNQERSGSLY